MATSRPRWEGGANSLMYIGALTEEHPIPKPPTNRKKRKLYQSMDRAEPTEDARNNTATQKSVFFRPIPSEGMPPSIAPITVPIKAIETVKPCSKTPRPQRA